MSIDVARLKVMAEQFVSELLDGKGMRMSGMVIKSLQLLGAERAEHNANDQHLGMALVTLNSLSRFRNQYARRMSEAEKVLFVRCVADEIHERDGKDR